ncbi:hypothetical protein CTAYLR_003019 [Chrysophaeum taylorii]|uniref:Methyltransferase FkbM domain-containing protein n=1 Tax=Chrysophaeum taylorii TaxID=2483200 RepID=A0AAD7U7B6_9STRA|nr:hypothetical protein CTAYLR_003019 [Chrysophaeum taylorii]
MRRVIYLLTATAAGASPPFASIVMRYPGVDEAQSREICEAGQLCVPASRILWEKIREHMPDAKTIVDVGANKGLVSAELLYQYAPSCGVDSASLRGEVKQYFEERGVNATPGGPCGAYHGRSPLFPDPSLCETSAVRVHSFEPNHHLVAMNRALNRARHVWRWHASAVSDFDGEAQFYTVWHEGSHLSRINTSDTVSVRVVRLDTWAKHHLARDADVDVLKIDAEGHDGATLAGAFHLFTARRIGLVIFEVPLQYPLHFGLHALLRDDDLLDFFEAVEMTCYVLGYNAHVLLSHGANRTLRLNGLRRKRSKCRQARNYACVNYRTRPALADALLRRSLAYTHFTLLRDNRTDDNLT